MDTDRTCCRGTVRWAAEGIWAARQGRYGSEARDPPGVCGNSAGRTVKHCYVAHALGMWDNDPRGLEIGNISC